MARLPSTVVSSILADNPDLVAFLQGEQAALKPGIYLHDVTVLPTALEARLKVELTLEPRDSVWCEFLTRNGIGTNQPTNYTFKQGKLDFHPGTTVREIVVSLKGNNVVGNTIEVIIGATIYGGATLTKGLAKIQFSNALVEEEKLGYELFYHTDFLTDFETSDSGLSADGGGIWQSRPTHGRTQDGNKELGLYVDPVLHPGTNPFPIIDGKRAMRSEKLAAPIVYGGKYWLHSAAMINSRKFLTVRPGDRVEARLSMPVNGKLGAWPAFWLLPSDGSWPPEIDMMEWPIIKGTNNYNVWTFFATQHWGTNSARGYGVDTRNLGITEDLTKFHVYAVDLGATDITFFIDDKRVAVMEHRSRGETWFALLNMAMGGSWPAYPRVEDTANPGYPKAPFPPDATFPADMILDWLKVWRPA